MNTGDIVNGFKIKKITKLNEIESTFIEGEHIKTGAKFGWFKNDDINKTFSITFKTIPFDNTGVFHILEHSVLQGSKKYPVKEPFVELIKGSMNTFLNAMTFPDKTSYPVSSRNEKDFENLINVYMDSVLHPLIYENENIFLQEGWHFESKNEGEIPEYNGVVLNEMKGALSSVDSILYDKLEEELFKGNCYSYVSGGDPKYIVDLTYEDFLDTHRKFYHPSNSYIILDGDIDINRITEILDGYLKPYDKKECNFVIPKIEGSGLKRSEYFYAKGEEEDNENEGYLGLSYVIGNFDDIKKVYAIKILIDYLVETNDSPLKKEVLKRKFATDISARCADSMYQPFLTLVFRNIDPLKRDEIEDLVYSKIKDIRDEGLNKEILEALLMRLEFDIKERNFGGLPTGIANSLISLDSWLYDGDPTLNFTLDGYFKELKEEIKDGTIEKYLDEVFLNNNHRVSVLMKPSTTYLKDEEDREKDKIYRIYSKMSESDKKALWDKEQKLKKWQTKPNSEEDLKCLPYIKISDISRDVEEVNNKFLSDGTLFHHGRTKGIRYLNIYFPIVDITEDEMAEISFVSSLYSRLPLKDMDKPILDMKCNRTFGGLGFFTNVDGTMDDPNHAYVTFLIEISYLKENEEDAFSLLKDILFNTDFDRSDYILDILNQEIEDYEQDLISSGHSYAIFKANSRVSERGRYADYNDGNKFIKYIKEALKRCEEDPKGFSKRLFELSNRLLSTNNMLVSITSDGEEIEYTKKLADLLLIDSPKFNRLSVNGKPYKDEEDDNPYIIVPTSVSYAALSGSLSSIGHKGSGKWKVFSKIVSMDYLWNKIRVLGGAYGGGMGVSYSGNILYYSYRDPSPEKSVEVFKNTPNYMEDYIKGNPDLSRIIIGTISDTEPVHSVSQKGRMGDVYYLGGITDEMRRTFRKEILETNLEDLKELSSILQKLTDKMSFAIVSNRDNGERQ